MVHAIGKGIVVPELQQSSDIISRVYDYDRSDEQAINVSCIWREQNK
ncbi:hypothetical protein [Neobacillus sp. Marseille-QA0830]